MLREISPKKLLDCAVDVRPTGDASLQLKRLVQSLQKVSARSAVNNPHPNAVKRSVKLPSRSALYRVGRECGVGLGLGVTLGVAVGDGVGVAVGVTVGVGVGVGPAVGYCVTNILSTVPSVPIEVRSSPYIPGACVRLPKEFA